VELSGNGAVHGRRRSGTEPVFGQEPGDGGWAERDLDPTHRSAASRARVEVGTKHMREQPRPTVARWGAGVVFVGVGVVAAERGKRELVARRGGGSALGGIARGFWDDFTPQSGVAREDPEIPATR
jgi:hypothetical protein